MRAILARNGRVFFLLVLVALLATLVGPAGATGAAPATAGNETPLGVPHHLGVAVADVSTVTGELSAATGTQFRPVRTTTSKVLLASGQIKQVRLKRAISVRGGPFVEVVQASPAVGPFAAGARNSTVFMSYGVDNVAAASLSILKTRAAQLVALDLGGSFAYFRSGGVLIRLIDKDAMPAAGGVNQPQAGMDLGVPSAFALYPCDIDATADQLGAALGVAWREPAVFTLPYEFSDGTTPNLTSTLVITRLTRPNVGLGTPHGAPLEPPCSATGMPWYLVYLTDDPPAAERQFAAAGLEFVLRIPGFEAAYRTTSGVYVQAAHTSFAPPPLD